MGCAFLIHYVIGQLLFNHLPTYTFSHNPLFLLPPYQVKNPPNRSLGEHKTHIEIICKSATPYGLRLFSFYQRYTLDVCFDR